MSHRPEGDINKTIKLPQLPWHEPRELELCLPNNWRVEVCNIAGYNRPAMDDGQIRASVTTPIGIPPLRKFARGKKEVVILFDDLTRATRVWKIVPIVLEELAEAGIPDSKIRFIAALGTHGAMDRVGFSKKLGEATLARFPVYNHNPFDNCTHVGTTSRGTKLFVNAEVMQCDLKIAISSVTPHPSVGFAGGGKMILPGVASIESVEANHALARGEYATNSMRLDMEEAAKLAGLDFVIGCILSLWGDVVGIYAGAEEAAHEAAVKEARHHYLCPMAENKDIVIANTYAKVIESAIGVRTTASLSQNGGSLVIIANAPEGQVVHYLGGVWGRTTAGKKKIRFSLPQKAHRLIVYTKYPDIAGLGFIEPSDKILQMSNWDDVIDVLQRFHGDHAKVALYPSADILHFG